MLKKHLLLLPILGLILGYSQVLLAAITLSHTQVTDVTPSSFSILWHASEASVPRVDVYLDAAATQDITDQVEIIRFPLQAASSGLTPAYQ